MKSVKGRFDVGDAGMVLEEREESYNVSEEVGVVVPAVHGDLSKAADGVS